MLKYSSRKCGKLTLAVVAVKVSMVVALMIDFAVYAPAFRAYIPVLVLGLNDEIYRIVLGREPLKKSNWFILLAFVYGAKVRTL